jgi:hypothetical protein
MLDWKTGIQIVNVDRTASSARGFAHDVAEKAHRVAQRRCEGVFDRARSRLTFP